MTRKTSPKDALESVLLRSRRRCAICYISGDAAPKDGDVAHIVALNKGGNNSPENLVYLCPMHHAQFDMRPDEITPDYMTSARDRLYTDVLWMESAVTSPRPKVFVVHGNDDALKNQLVSYLHHRGLAPVLLNEEPTLGLTILEKLDKSSNVWYAIALLTPDEVIAGKAGVDRLTGRPSPNVLFELGFLLGRLGRDRVCVLYDPKVELPSDFYGTTYIPMDSTGLWQKQLDSEFHNVGIA